MIRSKNRAPERRIEIARKGAAARWAALPEATHDGVLIIGDTIIPCAVLGNKQRVLTQSGVMKALGRARQAKGRSYYDGDVNLPAFLTAKNLKPFIPNELYVTSSQIEFRRRGAGKAFGYPAELLPKVCAVFDDADRAGALTAGQKHVAEKARILLRASAQVSIVALVDEATGCQFERERDELHRLLAVYLSAEKLAWAKKFPDEFYRQLYRLKDWRWPTGQAPFVGHLTNKLIYERLPEGVLGELRRKNPTEQTTGRRKWKHHQFLSKDIGQPDLRDHILQLVAVMRASKDWESFVSNFEMAFPKRDGQTVSITCET